MNQFPPRASSYKISYLYLYQNLYNMCIILSPFLSKLPLPYVADVAGGERTEELPLQSMATHGRSSSLPAIDVAGGERTGGAPPRGNGARRAAGQIGRKRGSRAMLTAGKSATRGRCGAGEVVGDGG